MQKNLSYLSGKENLSRLVCSNLCIKKQGGLIFRSAFGRMISPKQITVCLCHLFQGKLFRCKSCPVAVCHRLNLLSLQPYLLIHKLFSVTCQSNIKCLFIFMVFLKTKWLWLSASVCRCSRKSHFHNHFYHGAHLRVTLTHDELEMQQCVSCIGLCLADTRPHKALQAV